jgi:PHP family Zn ribbon phosphoesterase
MGEPGFYHCKKCDRCWQRYELKAQANPPRICPHCSALPEEQETDQVREAEYMRDVYGVFVKTLLGDSTKPKP